MKSSRSFRSDARLRWRRGAALCVVGSLAVAGLAACSSDEQINRAALTTTTDFAPTHSQAIDEEIEQTYGPVPDDDGGALCTAVEQWIDQEGPDPAGGPAALGDAIAASTDAFEQIVIPATPSELSSQAQEMAQVMRDAATSLQSFRDDPRQLDELMREGLVDPYETYMAMLMPRAYDPEATEWANEFLAWTSAPCGPKPTSLDYVAPTTAQPVLDDPNA